MKAFIDKIFKRRKHDAEQIEENKAILSKQIETSIKEKVTQDAVKEIIEEVKEDIKKETKVEVQHNLKSRYKG